MKQVIFFVLLGLSSLALAGTRDGGGGIGVRCPSGVGAPKAFELLDLHEARIRGLQVNYNPQSEDEAVNLTADLVAAHSWNPYTVPLAEDEAALAEHIMKPLFDGRPLTGDWGKFLSVKYVSSLPLSNDIGQYNILPGCTLEQIAYMDDATSTLEIVQSDWQELDWLNKSALLSHEINYFMERQEGLEDFGLPAAAMTSRRIRIFNGLLYSAQGVHPKFDVIPSTSFINCRNSGSQGGTDFWAFSSGPSQVTVVISDMYNMTSPYRTTAIFNGVQLTDFTDPANGEMNSLASLIFADETDAPAFNLILTKAKGAAPLFQAVLNQPSGFQSLGTAQEISCQ